MPSAQTPVGTNPRLRLLGALLVAVVLCAAGLLQAGSARGETKAEKLANVRERQSAISDELQSHNGEINELIGQVSSLRERESTADAELTARQEELDQASAELQDGRARLEELRVELRRSTREMEQMLVAMYKSGEERIDTVLLQSADFQALATQNEYLQRIGDYQTSVISRTRSLREEAEGLVAQLADTRDRVEAARDAIAARREGLASSAADLESQQTQLAAARKQRRQALAGLDSREDNLVKALSQPVEPPSTTPPPPTASDPDPAPAPVAGESAQLGSDGKAIPPAGAPPAVKAAIEAANAISDKPYVWGGGHGSFEASGYDCSGAVSYALHGGGLLSSPLDSTGLMFWGESGAGKWITVYANSGHVYVVIAGLRFDTSGSGGSGPRWQTAARSSAGFVARHPAGL